VNKILGKNKTKMSWSASASERARGQESENMHVCFQ
jgi:hypothetical protein